MGHTSIIIITCMSFQYNSYNVLVFFVPSVIVIVKSYLTCLSVCFSVLLCQYCCNYSHANKAFLNLIELNERERVCLCVCESVCDYDYFCSMLHFGNKYSIYAFHANKAF